IVSMPRCGCQGHPALYSSGLSLRKSSKSRNGSNSLVSPKPKARRRCTPAPSVVGVDWLTRLTARIDMDHLQAGKISSINFELQTSNFELGSATWLWFVFFRQNPVGRIQFH